MRCIYVTWVKAEVSHESRSAHGPAKSGALLSPDVSRLNSALAGRVTDEQGAAVSSAEVCASVPRFLARDAQDVCVRSDERGAFSFLTLVSGVYVVSAAATHYVAGSANNGRPLNVRAHVPVADLSIVLKHGGARLSGVVEDAIGGPIAHATVRVSSGSPPYIGIRRSAPEGSRPRGGCADSKTPREQVAGAGCR